MSRRLTLEEPQKTRDGAGGYVENWVAIGAHWAAIKPRTGRLTNGQTGAVSVGAFQIVTRGAPQGHVGRPDPGQRFRMGDRVFRIEAVTEEEPSGQYLICQCKEEVAP